MKKDQIDVDHIIEMIDKQIAELEEQEKKEHQNKPIPTIDIVMKELNQLIGLNDVKKEFEKMYLLLEYCDKMKKLNYPIDKKLNLNMFFLGNPGTGKTTVARLVTKMLYDMHYIEKKQFIEVTAKDLIAEYVGQTAIKTTQVLQKAKGGVLFIDEAYILGEHRGGAFNEEAIVELIKELEKKEIIFIFAGYEKEMEKFIEKNPGLKSRVSKRMVFPDFTSEELERLFLQYLEGHHLKISAKTLEKVNTLIEMKRFEKHFGNARTIETLYEEILLNHAYNTQHTFDSKELITITSNDLPILFPNVKEVGF